MEPFTLRIAVRGYELDTQGHVNQAVYLQYAEHVRWECLRAAGVPREKLLAGGVGPVALETTIRYLRELSLGDEVDVILSFDWAAGRTFRIRQNYQASDGTPVAELAGVGGLLDLTTRRLVPDPRERFRALATEPGLLGL